MFFFYVLAYFAEYYTNHCSTFSEVYPGVREVLEHLRAKGKKISVATFKIRSATMKIFKDFDLEKYINIVITADDVANPKPAPDCILAILDYYECRADEAILIGDTKTDYMLCASVLFSEHACNCW